MPAGDVRSALAVAVVVLSAIVYLAFALLQIVDPFLLYYPAFVFFVGAVGVFVFQEVSSLARPDITGAAFWWLSGAVLLPIVFLPLYVYLRRQFAWRAAHEAILSDERLGDLTNPFIED